ncbi:MAG: STN and carboxypeptidase regulatory-like domain-containing protein [Mangrovibacterium sp.]|nr:STN and carboxypeptidase regulatory-like domain-containing protein [Mangrovibacterium sp.]
MKKKRNECFPYWGSGLKLFRVMKLITFLVLAGFLQVSASIYSQTANIKLDIKTSSLDDVIQKIQNQTDFVFFYSPDDIAGILVSNVELDGVSLEEALDKCLKNTHLEYKVKYNAVIIKGAEAEPGIQNQQGLKITGSVSDDDGELMPGVNVVVKGTTMGTTTDSKGEFAITVPKLTEI